MNDLTIFEELESSVRYYCRQTPNLFATAREAKVWDADGNEFIDFLAGCGSLDLGHHHLPSSGRSSRTSKGRHGERAGLPYPRQAISWRDSETSSFDPGNFRMSFSSPAPPALIASKRGLSLHGKPPVAGRLQPLQMLFTECRWERWPRPGRRRLATASWFDRRRRETAFRRLSRCRLGRVGSLRRDGPGLFGRIEPIAAITVETLQGEGGLNVASGFEAQADIECYPLLIVNDIQAGCGRTGDFFSFERAGLVPDIVCLSKSISGAGLPMALLLVLPQFDVWRPGEHNGTFRGNNFAFVTGAAAMDLWREGSLAAEVTANSAALDAWLADTGGTFPELIERRRRIGMMVGLQFRNPDVAKNVAEQARAEWLLIETCGPYDQVIKDLSASQHRGRSSGRGPRSDSPSD